MILPNFTNPLTYVSAAWNILISEFFSEHQKDGPEVRVFNNIQRLQIVVKQIDNVKGITDILDHRQQSTLQWHPQMPHESIRELAEVGLDCH
jgi:hypothetical protein